MNLTRACSRTRSGFKNDPRSVTHHPLPVTGGIARIAQIEPLDSKPAAPGFNEHTASGYRPARII